MKNSVNKRFILVIFIMLFTFLTIGYAYLTQNLNINGSSIIHNVSWNIYFDNVNVIVK